MKVTNLESVKMTQVDSKYNNDYSPSIKQINTLLTNYIHDR